VKRIKKIKTEMNFLLKTKTKVGRKKKKKKKKRRKNLKKLKRQKPETDLTGEKIVKVKARKKIMVEKKTSLVLLEI
jgi:hypothetical protein